MLPLVHVRPSTHRYDQTPTFHFDWYRFYSLRIAASGHLLANGTLGSRGEYRASAIPPAAGERAKNLITGVTTATIPSLSWHNDLPRAPSDFLH